MLLDWPPLHRSADRHASVQILSRECYDACLSADLWVLQLDTGRLKYRLKYRLTYSYFCSGLCIHNLPDSPASPILPIWPTLLTYFYYWFILLTCPLDPLGLLYRFYPSPHDPLYPLGSHDPYGAPDQIIIYTECFFLAFLFTLLQSRKSRKFTVV